VSTKSALPHQPRFQGGVTLAREGAMIDVSHRGGGCVIELDPATAEQSAGFLAALQDGGWPRDVLAARYDQLPIATLLDQLDGLGLITDAPAMLTAGITGGQCYRRARRVLAPMLAQADDYASMMIARRFYQSEMNHDRMLLQSLAAVDIDPTTTTLQPLPSTFAMVASLGVLAAQFPLALKAVLFVLEEPQPEYNDAFRQNCERLGLPSGFVAPIARHSDVNEGEAHDDISRDLLERVELVTEEEAIEVEKAVTDLTEQLAAAGQEIHDWYGGTDEVRLRDF
jgi:Iron-containing redox enzyme